MGRGTLAFFKSLTWNFFFHSQQVDRLWRKNRRPVLSLGSVNIIGVDLNRNFPNENWGAYSFQIWFWMTQIWMFVEIDRYKIWFFNQNTEFTIKIYLRNQPEIRKASTVFPAKWRLTNARRNSILVTFHQPGLGSAFYWLKQISSTARAGQLQSLSV